MVHAFAVLVCALLIVADQYTKYLAEVLLMPVRNMPFIPGFLEFYYHTNEGAAFGLFQGARWIFLIITAILLIAGIIFYIKLPKGKVFSWIRWSMVIIFAGAVGNAIDRARQGYVVDFLNFEFISFPVFNVADICVVAGTILLGIIIIFFYREKPINDISDK